MRGRIFCNRRICRTRSGSRGERRIERFQPVSARLGRIADAARIGICRGEQKIVDVPLDQRVQVVFGVFFAMFADITVNVRVEHGVRRIMREIAQREGIAVRPEERCEKFVYFFAVQDNAQPLVFVAV